MIIGAFLIKAKNTKSQKPSDTKPPTDGAIVETIFSDTCQDVQQVYYKEPKDTSSYFRDTKDLNIFWDLRYHIPNVTTNCAPNLKFGATIDLHKWYADVDFGGPQSTLIYKLDKYNIFPWKTGNNLAIQLKMTTPYFKNFEGKTGGNIAINFFIIDQKTNKRLNYVISLYTLGVARDYETKDVLYDPSTNTNFISTHIKKGNLYTTISDWSSPTNAISKNPGEPNFFRVNITKENLLRIVDNPEDYKVTFIGIQYEIEEELGKAVVSSEFSGFSAYITTGAI